MELFNYTVTALASAVTNPTTIIPKTILFVFAGGIIIARNIPKIKLTVIDV